MGRSPEPGAQTPKALLDSLVEQLLENRRSMTERLHDDAIPAMVGASLRLHALRRKLADTELEKDFLMLEDLLQGVIDRLRGLLDDVAGRGSAEGIAARLRSQL